MQPLADRIRALRSARRLTQADLAARIGTTRRVLSSWESGRPTPGDDIPNLARALGVTICELYGVQEGHTAGVDQDLSAAERAALDNIARELVKLRQPRPRRQRSGGQDLMREMVRAWPTMDEAERQEWRELAEEIRRADAT